MEKNKLIQKYNFPYMKEFFCLGVHRHKVEAFVFIGWSLKKITYKFHYINKTLANFLRVSSL